VHINTPKKQSSRKARKEQSYELDVVILNKDRGSCHNRQKPRAATSQAPIRNRQTRKVANFKVRNRYTNRGAFDSAKNHKRQHRKRQSVTAKREKSQTPKLV